MKKNLPALRGKEKDQTNNQMKTAQIEGFSKQQLKQIVQPSNVKYLQKDCQEYQAIILEDFVSSIVRQSLIYMRSRQGSQLEENDVKATLRLFGAKGNL